MPTIPEGSIDAIITDLPYGTTGEACIKTGREFIGIEKEEKYYSIAVNRLKQAEKNFQYSIL